MADRNLKKNGGVIVIEAYTHINRIRGGKETEKTQKEIKSTGVESGQKKVVKVLAKYAWP